MRLSLPLSSADIESLERATLQAVAPEQVQEIPGWLLPMDHGTVGRAHSAAPTAHESIDPGAANHIAAAYEAKGFRPVFRVPDRPAFDSFRARLKAMGFTGDMPTLTQVGSLERVVAALRHLGTEGVSLEERPDAAWTAMFLGEGFDPVDGASRATSLARAQGTRYVSHREEVNGSGQTLACAAASFGHGWLGLHGLRTESRQRGRGLAGKVLLAMALKAQAQGIARMYLQVHASSTSVLALYRRIGLETAWGYSYWRDGAG